MKTNRILSSLITAVVLLSAGVQARCETIPATDGRVTIIGRTQATDGTVSFDWTGVYVKVRFQGSSLCVKLSDTNKNYYNVWIDSPMSQAPCKVISTSGQDTTICLFSQEQLKELFGRKGARAPHQVILQKRTEGFQGCTTLQEFTTDGIFLQADAPSDRVIEYIGDSYTCGYGTEATHKDRFSPETENQNLTYACATARYFGAEQLVTAHSGMGIARNYDGKNTEDNMAARYLKTFDRQDAPDWTPAPNGPKPAITVIYLGTNDFSTGMQPAQRVFVRNYIKLLKEIKAFYGEEHPVLCMAPKHDILIFEYIKKAVDTCNLPAVHILGLSPSVHNDVEDMGADGHPNYSGHKKIAYSLIPCISTLTGWEMTASPVE